MAGDEAGERPGPRAGVAVWIVLVLVLGGIAGFSVWRSEQTRSDAARSVVAEIGCTADEIAGQGPEGPATGIFPASPGALPDVPATERSGRAMRTAELRGAWNAVSFLFTSCGGTCPRLAHELKTLHDAAPAGLRLVTFTVDPATDTPAVLTRYADALGADPARWLFLRTTLDDVQSVARALKFNSSLTDPVTHSNAVMIVDPAGRAVAMYQPLDDPRWLTTLRADFAKLRAAAPR